MPCSTLEEAAFFEARAQQSCTFLLTLVYAFLFPNHCRVLRKLPSRIKTTVCTEHSGFQKCCSSCSFKSARTKPRSRAVTKLATLARLGRTSKIFSDPALDVLWSFQDTIFNVIKCMPPAVWSYNWTLRRPIMQSDWDRALRYIYRVRYFSCSPFSFPACVYPTGLFETLRLSLPAPHLFPQLRRLRWMFYTHTFLPPAPFLFTPTLTDISLGAFRTITQLSLLPALAVKCPLLTHVQIIQDVVPGIDPSRIISSFICGLDHVESLKVARLDQKAHDHLSALPRLKTLILTTPDIDASTTPPHFSRTFEPRFTSLCHFTLSSTTSQSILALIPSLSHSPLESLALRDIHPSPDASSVRQIFAALKKWFPRTTLRCINVASEAHLTEAGHGQPEPPAITIKTFRPLFHFTHLTSVKLRPPTGIDVADEDVLALAEAWPQLEHLFLRTRSAAHPPRATLRSLLHLAEHCAKLATLQLIVDASTVPPIERSEHKARILHYALRHWTVGAPSLISSPIQVARFLSGIFPALDGISVYGDDYDEDDDGSDTDMQSWDEVGTALPICHEMREEERFWIRQSQGALIGYSKECIQSARKTQQREWERSLEGSTSGYQIRHLSVEAEGSPQQGLKGS
ncbi:hypothetical protein C8F04DRAFT_1228274 [Mycena alexandri]|uniref:F-box domain-containing protein n=1 Tax=Mycena alexandri TaxID=1745969 RepID=A0AAD6XER5_9AGAR|nr:hypothetical protein C8F04DRAFT_1228274 [Mycena alexandri]